MTDTDSAATRSELEEDDLVYLEKLRLAADVILQAGEDPGVLPDTFQTELYLFKDRVERALLLRPVPAADLLPWRNPAPVAGGEARALTRHVPPPDEPSLSRRG